VAGPDVRYELGAFPFMGETPVGAMLARGAVAAAGDLGLQPHEPWNEGRVATYLLRAGVGVDLDAANAGLAGLGFGWCELIDNGPAVHLAPAGTGKAAGVRADREHHGLDAAETAYVGDSRSDVACAHEVGRFWLVANADPSITGVKRTRGAYGDGVAEVVHSLLALI
jgi:hypothetical protein